MRYKSIFITAVFILSISFLVGSLQAKTMKQALDEAARFFVKQAVKIESGEELHVMEIVNFSSKEQDIEGKRIETEMYFALERQFPDFKIFLGPGKSPEDDVLLTGSYEQKANKVVIKFKVTRDNEVLAATEVDYETSTRRKTLVAILDLEAAILTDTQKRVFSDVFRAELNRIGAFDLASSADIDKMDPDAIQAKTGCTRDTCATIIGEQLGVDRVISSSLAKVDEDFYFLSAKMMDIRDGSILVTKTVEHTGKIRNLKPSIEKLAQAMAEDEEKMETVSRPEDEVESEGLEEESSNFIWHVAAISATVGSAFMAMSNANSYNELAEKNDSLYEDYQAAISKTELQRIRNEISANQDQMASHKSNIQLFNGLTAVALLWEAYLIFFTGEDSETARILDTSDNLTLAVRPVLMDRQTLSSVSLQWTW